MRTVQRYWVRSTKWHLQTWPFLCRGWKCMIKFLWIIVSQCFSNVSPLLVSWTIRCLLFSQASSILRASLVNDGLPGYVSQSSFIVSLFYPYYINHYYSFKIFSCFWLVKTTRIIQHNLLLLTKFAKNFVIFNRWRQKCCSLQIIEPLTEKTWGQGLVCYLTKSKMAVSRFTSLSEENILNEL